MHLELILRRAVVMTGATLSLVTGGLAIRTAADWAVAATTKVEPPAGIIELQARIDAADVKAAAIRSQIDRLATGSGQLAEMIDMANRLAVTDGDAADALRAELDETKQALVEAERSPTPDPTRAPTRTATRTTSTATTTGSTTTSSTSRTSDEHDDDHHDGRDDD